MSAGNRALPFLLALALAVASTTAWADPVETVGEMNSVVRAGTVAPGADCAHHSNQVTPKKKKKKKKKKAKASPYCVSPAKAICEGSDENQDERKQRVVDYQRGIRAKALAAAGLTEEDMFTNDLDHKTASIAKYAAKREEIMKEEFRRLQKPVLEKWAPKVIKHLRSAAASNLMDGYISDNLHDQLVAKTDLGNTIKIVSAPETLTASYVRQGDRDALKKSYEKWCGNDGMKTSVAIYYTNETRYIIVCPGWLVANGEEDGSGMNFFNLLWTLGHEGGHPVDAHNFPDEYRGFKACIREHHPGITVPTGDSQKTPAQLLDERSGEVSADYWGAETIADFLESSGLDDRASVEKVIKLSMRNVCPLSAGDHYPRAKDRINFVIGANPRLRKLLGCPALDPGAGSAECTLQGER